MEQPKRRGIGPVTYRLGVFWLLWGTTGVALILKGYDWAPFIVSMAAGGLAYNFLFDRHI